MRNDGSLYVSQAGRDGEPGRVFKVAPDGTPTVAAGGGSQRPQSETPAVDVDFQRILRITTDKEGALCLTGRYDESDFIAKVQDDLLTSIHEHHDPIAVTCYVDVAIGSDHEVYVGRDVDQIWKITRNFDERHFVKRLYYPSEGAECCLMMYGLLATSNQHLLVSRPGLGKNVLDVNPSGDICIYAGGGTSTDEGAHRLELKLGWPTDIALDHTGRLYIADFDAQRVIRIDRDGNAWTVVPRHDGFRPARITVNAQGTVIYVINSATADEGAQIRDPIGMAGHVEAYRIT